jgi:hypothetical protein
VEQENGIELHASASSLPKKFLVIKAVGVFEKGPSAKITDRGVCQESNTDTQAVSSHLTG